MSPKLQNAFITELTDNIAKELRAQINTGQIPEHWDGHELRALLAIRFTESAAMSLITREPRSKRTRDFINTRITENL